MIVRAFRSDIRVMGSLLTKMAVAGTVLLISATVIGQWRAGRFPSYGDLAISLLIAPAGCLAIWILFYLAAIVFPVKVLQDGIQCYDSFGRYRSVKWKDVIAVDFLNMYGLKYVVLHASTLKQPVTLPLYLADMDEFRRLVESQAGPDHMVVKALRASAT